MTGLAIVFYLNQYAPQPRERDYAYAGSFYAFAIWIGLGIIKIAQWLQKKLGTLVALLISIVFGGLTVFIMAQQGWDDHDRSGRYTSLALAENYLNSCSKDAILFTNGDNDTFPLWYAQEVEGIRTDVRVINLSLLNADWCIDQIRRKAYDSDPVPMSMSKNTYRTGNHDVTYFFPDEQLKDRYTDLKDVFDIINTDETKLKVTTPQYGTLDYLPTRKFMLTYDPVKIVADKSIPAKYLSRLDTVKWEIKNDIIEKSKLVVLDILAANNWKRPVYFELNAGPESYIGLENSLFVEGLNCRILPVKERIDEKGTGEVNTDLLYDNLMNKFNLRDVYNKKVYLDDQNQHLVLSYRNLFGRLADALIQDGKKDSARKVLDYCMSVFPDEVFHYDY